jgi:polyhydroxybutyrate depolymerase
MRTPLRLLLLVASGLLVAACSASAGAPIPDALPDAAEPQPPAADAAPPSDASARDATPPPNGSKGCGNTGALAKPGPVSGLVVGVGAAKRTYALSVPVGYDAYRGYPLVFNFHSGGRTGASARDYFAFEAFAGDKAIFVYPDGEKGNWDLDTTAAQNKDVAFFDALLAEVEANLCVDTTRVFATGSSMGAYLTNQLGCRRGDVLRAIAPHAGGGPWETGGKYDAEGHLICAQKAPAAMVFIGLADTNVDPAEGEKSLKHWSWANGCEVQTSPATPSPCVSFQGCGKPVVSCKIPGVGHRIWSEGPKATWEFFASF